MNWITKFIKPKIKSLFAKKSAKNDETLWTTCGCKNLIYKEDLQSNFNCCPKCGLHHKLSCQERFQLFFDNKEFEIIETPIPIEDPLNFEDSKKYKNRLKKLVFIGGSYRMPVNQDLIDLAKNGDSDAVKLMMKWCYEGSKKFIGGSPIKRIIQSPKDIRKILAVDLVACNNYLNGSNAVKTIDCPSMFVFGALDKMVNLDVGKKFANMVENSTTHIIDGCGHMIMIEKAFEIREKVLEFLQK